MTMMMVVTAVVVVVMMMTMTRATRLTRTLSDVDDHDDDAGDDVPWVCLCGLYLWKLSPGVVAGLEGVAEVEDRSVRRVAHHLSSQQHTTHQESAHRQAVRGGGGRSQGKQWRR
jgi:hypothetical protein